MAGEQEGELGGCYGCVCVVVDLWVTLARGCGRDCSRVWKNSADWAERGGRNGISDEPAVRRNGPVEAPERVANGVAVIAVGVAFYSR